MKKLIERFVGDNEEQFLKTNYPGFFSFDLLSSTEMEDMKKIRDQMSTF